MFTGRLALIYPHLNPQTRTARVRVEIANPNGVLRPDQNGTALQDGGSRPALSASALKLRLLKRLKCTTRFEKAAWATGALLVAASLRPLRR